MCTLFSKSTCRSSKSRLQLQTRFPLCSRKWTLQQQMYFRSKTNFSLNTFLFFPFFFFFCLGVHVCVLICFVFWCGLFVWWWWVFGRGVAVLFWIGLVWAFLAVWLFFVCFFGFWVLIWVFVVIVVLNRKRKSSKINLEFYLF